MLKKERKEKIQRRKGRHLVAVDKNGFAEYCKYAYVSFSTAGRFVAGASDGRRDGLPVERIARRGNGSVAEGVFLGRLPHCLSP